MLLIAVLSSNFCRCPSGRRSAGAKSSRCSPFSCPTRAVRRRWIPATTLASGVFLCPVWMQGHYYFVITSWAMQRSAQPCELHGAGRVVDLRHADRHPRLHAAAERRQNNASIRESHREGMILCKVFWILSFQVELFTLFEH